MKGQGDWDREQARSTEEVVKEARSGLVKKQVGLEGQRRDRCSAAKKQRDLARFSAIELSQFRARGERLASAGNGKNGLGAWDSG